MYLDHFGLMKYPFDKNISVSDMFLHDSAKELEARIGHLLDVRGIGLVTGDSGAGKTTLCRRIATKLHPGTHRVFYIPNSTGNVLDLYKSICWELGLVVERSRAGLYRSIQQAVSGLILESRIFPILIIDEAHHLRTDVLEDLRLLTNYEMDSENRLCLLFIGQTELRRRLNLSVYEALNQRIIVRQHLNGLTPEEVNSYLYHLLRKAGTETKLFEEGAMHNIYQSTGGLPRRVNLLAHHALMVAAARRSKTVTSEHVTIAVEDIT